MLIWCQRVKAPTAVGVGLCACLCVCMSLHCEQTVSSLITQVHESWNVPTVWSTSLEAGWHWSEMTSVHTVVHFWDLRHKQRTEQSIHSGMAVQLPLSQLLRGHLISQGEAFVIVLGGDVITHGCYSSEHSGLTAQPHWVSVHVCVPLQCSHACKHPYKQD